jgi:hypothetical protein
MAARDLLDLDPLVEWCRVVLERGLQDVTSLDEVTTSQPAVQTTPPLPDDLRVPLRAHGFDEFDETALALTLAPDLDADLAALVAALNGVPGRRYPTLATIAHLVGARGPERVSLAARLSDDGPLAQVGLVQIVPPADAPVQGEPPRGPSMLASCVGSTALLRWANGATRLQSALRPYVRDDLIAPSAPPDPVVAALLDARVAIGRPTVTSLVGAHPGHALSTALYAVAQTNRNVLIVAAEALVEQSSAARIAAEAVLRRAVVIVRGPAGNVPAKRWETLATSIVIGAYPNLEHETLLDSCSLTVNVTSEATVGTHLVEVLRGTGVKVSLAEAERMARWKHLRHDDIGQLAATLSARAAGRTVAGEAPEVTSRDVSEVSIGVVGHELSRLATPLVTSRDWRQLVLVPDLREQVMELVEQAAGRSQVFDDDGFGALPGQPRGVTAIFAGPSGTGKTLAARLVAGELGLPLYAVNLAATVSKYVGETERNLDAVFAAAEQTDAVLLFDEAEALFGKRSEVQDARDRYANLEISFLLQRMERYDGVAILATNLLEHFDDAFSRRISFCLHFPYPDEDQRSLIWRAVWPQGFQLAADVDLDELATRHPLCGGHIRNIALSAAHLARARGTLVDDACLRRAVDREYAKLGQVVDPVPGGLA